MIPLAIMLAQAATSPTFGEAMRLSARAAGDLVLDGKQHEPIVEIVVPEAGELWPPPGLAELQLVERPTFKPIGCTRRRWIATFRSAPGVSQADAALSDARAAVEIALPQSRTCPEGQYVRLNPAVGPMEAFKTLAHLQNVRSGVSRVRFACSDTTGSSLCGSDELIQRQLAKISPWALTRQAGIMSFWLGTPGKTVTEVWFNSATPDHVFVVRKYPAPS